MLTNDQKRAVIDFAKAAGEKIMAIYAQDFDIEDAAQSFGAEYKGKKSCNLSTIGYTSFFPSKPLGCYGDGGAIFTNDESIALACREIRGHGQSQQIIPADPAGGCARHVGECG